MLFRIYSWNNKSKAKLKFSKLLSRKRHCTLQLKSKPDKRQTTALSNMTETERYEKRVIDIARIIQRKGREQ